MSTGPADASYRAVPYGKASRVYDVAAYLKPGITVLLQQSSLVECRIMSDS